MTFSAILATQGVIALVTALVYGYVGRLVVARPISHDARLANVAFATWWWMFGAVEFLAAAYTFPAAFGYRDLVLAVTLIDLLLVLIALAIGALVYFLVYVYTGARWAIWPIVFAYASLAAGLVLLIAWMHPVGFDDAAGPGQLAYEHKLSGAPAMLLGLTLSVPVLVAAVGYGSLFFRAHDPERRLRIASISVAFLAWFGWSALSTLLQLQERHPGSIGLFALNSAIGLAVPLVIAASYRPPAFLRRRFEMEAPLTP